MKMEDVENAIAIMQDDGENEESLMTMYRTLQHATPILEAIIEAIRQRLDEAFLEHMGPDSTVSQQFGDSQSPEWNKAVSQYEHAVEQSIGEAIEESRRAGLFESDKLSASAITALKTCLPKIKVILCIGSQKITSPFFPLMSRSVYSHMRTMLETISGAILEKSVIQSTHRCAGVVLAWDWSLCASSRLFLLGLQLLALIENDLVVVENDDDNSAPSSPL
ncbi:hypothetical protein BU15DRAFT_64981 [Melanogaster broomeanus]|nr:hypothetical protein BU15DRAFT_64981 [Melanogaster broomeanus]